jgi:hypothetical protein
MSFSRAKNLPKSFSKQYLTKETCILRGYCKFGMLLAVLFA